MMQTISNLRRGFLLAAAACSILGCGEAAETPEPRDDLGEAGIFTFHLEVDDPLPAGPIDGTLTITRDGAPVAGAYVWVAARMPSHTHDASALRAEEIEAGTYLIDGLELGMPGDWNLHLDAEAGGVGDSIVFEVSVR